MKYSMTSVMKQNVRGGCWKNIFFKKGKLNDFSTFYVPSVHKQEKNKLSFNNQNVAYSHGRNNIMKLSLGT